MTLQTVADDPRALRDAFACFPSGVTALCTLVEGKPVGLAASSFTAVSLAPPLVSVCIQTVSATWEQLQHAPRLGVSVLSEGHDAACRQLASKSGDRFSGIDWFSSETGAVFIEGSTALLECSLYRRYDAGDHELVLLEIHGMKIRPDLAPLVFHGSRFRRLMPQTSV